MSECSTNECWIFNKSSTPSECPYLPKIFTMYNNRFKGPCAWTFSITLVTMWRGHQNDSFRHHLILVLPRPVSLRLHRVLFELWLCGKGRQQLSHLASPLWLTSKAVDLLVPNAHPWTVHLPTVTCYPKETAWCSSIKRERRPESVRTEDCRRDWYEHKESARLLAGRRRFRL